MAAQPLLLVLVLVCLVGGCVASAFSNGDVIWTMKRTQFGKDQTAWHDVLGKDSPRFGVNRQVPLPMGTIIEESLRTKEPFKIMFSFGNDQFVTPWIEVSDGKGRVLNNIAFVFSFSGETIVNVKWKMDYNDGEHHNRILDTVTVNYLWAERRSMDVTLAVNVIFLLATVGTLAIVVYVMAADNHADRYKTAMGRKFGVIPAETPSMMAAAPSMGSSMLRDASKQS